MITREIRKKKTYLDKTKPWHIENFVFIHSIPICFDLYLYVINIIIYQRWHIEPKIVCAGENGRSKFDNMRYWCRSTDLSGFHKSFAFIGSFSWWALVDNDVSDDDNDDDNDENFAISLLWNVEGNSVI